MSNGTKTPENVFSLYFYLNLRLNWQLCSLEIIFKIHSQQFPAEYFTKKRKLNK